jgi:hypothetical protein
MFYEYHYETVWAASWDEVNELELPTHYHRKTMVIALFNGTREYTPNILPQSRSMDSGHIARKMIGGLEDAYYPEWRNLDQRKTSLPFDNASVHKIGAVI